MIFQPGMLVVCVDDAFVAGYPDREVRPKKGGIYTVRGNTFNDWYQVPAIWLVEIVNPPMRYIEGVGEASWFERRFRPVDDTRLEVFRKIAASPRKRIEVSAGREPVTAPVRMMRHIAGQRDTRGNLP